MEYDSHSGKTEKRQKAEYLKIQWDYKNFYFWLTQKTSLIIIYRQEVLRYCVYSNKLEKKTQNLTLEFCFTSHEVQDFKK